MIKQRYKRLPNPVTLDGEVAEFYAEVKEYKIDETSQQPVLISTKETPLFGVTKARIVAALQKQKADRELDNVNYDSEVTDMINQVSAL